MNFNSIEYMIFLPLIVILYYLMPYKYRWLLLLSGSYFFYMCWNIKYSLLMLTSTVITFASGLLIDYAKTIKWKKIWVAISFCSNLGILFFFKYYNFAVDSLIQVFDAFGIGVTIPNFEVLLPVGISFYTFQALSYTVDVYRGALKPTKHFGKYALFVSFFPQLVAGPIERTPNLLAQFDEEHDFDYDMAKRGFFLLLFGLFKKIVIADRLAILVDTVYSNVESYSGQAYWIAAFFFTFQIYCDFSGYSDMAIGSANILGYRLMKNFNAPYLAKSIAEFWRRWHISLSTWFRDYLYIPLGGSRVSFSRWCMNTMIVFLVSGLWHGANWTFVIWGVLHGVWQIIGRLKNNLLKKKYDNTFFHVVSVLITFMLVNFAWIFFRANTVSDAITICRGLFVKMDNFDILALGLGKADVVLSILLILLLYVTDIISSRHDIYGKIQSFVLPVRWAVYLCGIFFIIFFGIYGELSAGSFIYFQF